ncbi:MAG: beta-lactamase family protein [bacterium]|nr:MAG: beta-lactamase family protein [bacterium]
MKKTRLLVLVCSVIVAVVCRQAVAGFPELIEERRAVGFVKAVQAGDAQALLAYMHENWIPAQEGSDRQRRWPRITRMLTKRHAGLEIVGVEAEEPHRLTVVTRDPGGTTLRFIFDFEAADPFRIAGMSVEAGEQGRLRGGPELPPFELPEGAGEKAIVTAIGRWFEALSQRDLFSGTALVAWRGRPIFTGAWGLASREWNVPNRIDTRFNLGSINKSFTKIAIMQLALQGKLTLDDTIIDHLPGYPNGEVARKVTIRHLLGHTSGLGDIFNDVFFRSSKALYRDPRDFFPLFANEPLRFEPGERFEYSNAGYMVLGAIIEEVSGEPYDRYVVRHIFEQAGMKDSGFFAKDEPAPNIAVGYTSRGPGGEEGELRNNLFHLPIRGNSAGSAQSTVEDLLAFDTALREHTLLPFAYTEWYFGGEEPQPGSATETTAERASFGTAIAGGAPGVSAVLESDGDLAVITLSNYDPPITEAIARQLYRPLKRALSEVND